MSAGTRQTAPAAAAKELPPVPEEVLRGAEERLRERVESREATRRHIENREFDRLDSSGRRRARYHRLQGHPIAGNRLSPPGERGAAAVPVPEEALFERIIGGDNLLGISFFDLGRRAARCVGRIEIRTPDGRSGHGTGSLVSPRLLLTNNHVLPDAGWARLSRVVFDHEDDLDGNPRPTVTFALEPRAFFYTDPGLDFTVVAVCERSLSPSGASLAAYGFNPLDPTQGKISVGEPINIIQHPGGLPKQVVLQDNRLLDLRPDWLHYEADTMPGSSGAPLFNLEWEIVGLHHAGWASRDAQGRILTRDGRVWLRDMGEQAIHWLGNEGARVSRIVETLRAALPEFDPARQALLEPALTPRKRGTAVLPADAPGEGAAAPERRDLEPVPHADLGPRADGRAPAAPTPLTAGPASASTSIEIPLRITLTVGMAAAPGAILPEHPPAAAPAPEAFVFKEPFIERPLANRRGYDPGFLGLNVPLPEVTGEEVPAPLREGGGHVLLYEHFSIVVHRGRRMALFTAANVDWRAASRRPDPARKYDRDTLTGLTDNELEKWVTDDRLAPEHQLPDRFYTEDRRAFDKGHLVRRDDVCWGATYAQVRRANGDTYHTTNCSPQVKKYNQAGNSGNWGDLEKFIARQTAAETCCVFAGPVFRDTDREFRGVDDGGAVRVKIPRSFWKLIVTRKGDALEAFAFVLDQDLSDVRFEAMLREADLDDPRALEFLPDPEWQRKMLSVPALETLLGGLLRFPDSVRAADQFRQPDGEAVLEALGLVRFPE